MRSSINDVMLSMEEADVHFIRLQFTDIFGRLKNLAITRNRLEHALRQGIAFDGSALDGHLRGEETELILMPEPDTYCLLPWRPQQGSVARLVCRVLTPGGEPYAGDCRHILATQLEALADMGMELDIAPSIEFFLFRLDERGNPVHQLHDSGGYFDVSPADMGENTRRDICLNLESMGLEVLSSHHGLSPGQHVISFSADDALNVADSIITIKLVVRTIARTHGLHATFIPQPFEGVHGSGLNMLLSLADGQGSSIMDGEKYGLSDAALHFIGGLIGHAPAMSFLLNPIVNSYRRLAAQGTPFAANWSNTGGNPMLRVLGGTAGGEAGSGFRDKALALRSADSFCNPYLGIAAILAAGMDGVANRLDPGAPMDEAAAPLPESLGEAAKCFQRDGVINGIMPHIGPLLLSARQAEYQRSRTFVSRQEVDNYLAQE